MERWEIDPDNSLLPILEQAGDQPIEIIRNGEVIGRILPSVPHNRSDAMAAVEQLLSLKIDLKLAPGETIKDLINEGRKY